MKKTISIILLATMLLSLVACGKAKVSVKDNSESKTSSSDSQDSDNSAETKTTTVNLSGTVSNSEHCDMQYTLSTPDWEFEKEFYYSEDSKYTNYTREYKSTDSKLKFFVTEYLGTEKYPGQIDRSFGKSHHTEADAISGGIVDIAVKELTGYSDNQQILTKEPVKGDGNMDMYEFCLQLPNEYDGYFYVKGYVAVGIKHPVAVYFFDGTKDTIYDEEMVNKSLDIIKTLKIEKEQPN